MFRFKAYADPDHAFHFKADTDPDPAFLFDAEIREQTRGIIIWNEDLWNRSPWEAGTGKGNSKYRYFLTTTYRTK